PPPLMGYAANSTTLVKWNDYYADLLGKVVTDGEVFFSQRSFLALNYLISLDDERETEMWKWLKAAKADYPDSVAEQRLHIAMALEKWADRQTGQDPEAFSDLFNELKMLALGAQQVWKAAVAAD